MEKYVFNRKDNPYLSHTSIASILLHYSANHWNAHYNEMQIAIFLSPRTKCVEFSIFARKKEA